MRPDTKNRWMFALAACLVALMQDAGRGFSYFSDNGVTVVWTGNESIRYLSPSTVPPGSSQPRMSLRTASSTRSPSRTT